MKNFLMCLIVAKVASRSGPIGRGAGLDCDLNQLVQEKDCNLSDGFNVRFFSFRNSAFLAENRFYNGKLQ